MKISIIVFYEGSFDDSRQLDYQLAQRSGLKGSDDPSVLAFAAEQRLIILTHDLRTMPKHAYDRVHAGLRMPGVIALSDSCPIGKAIEELSLTIECSVPDELDNLILYLPL